MSSLVSDFIINPVLRQARRFSEISRSTLAGDGDDPSPADVPADAVIDSDIAEEPMETPTTHAMAFTPDLSPSRPFTSSTQDTRVEEPVTPPSAVGDVTHDHLGFPLSPSSKRSRGIPEDDGMGHLRRRIQAINAQDLSSTDKARLMHEVLAQGLRFSHDYLQSTPPRLPNHNTDDSTWEHTSPQGTLESLKFWGPQLGESSSMESFALSPSDIAPTFAPIRKSKSPMAESAPPSPPTPSNGSPPLGCEHYERNVKLQCFTCKKWYTCRFCHDAREDHSLIRKETRNMLCMLCATPQRASDICTNCGEMAAQYYCNICKLWENRQSKPIYHCSDCGICRRGLGLGKDFFHCKTCRACITTSIESSHKCIERSTDCDCPICGEYMFTSPKPVVFMTCGHSIHKKCYDQHMRVSYKCPICNKSLANMETQFRNLDVAIQAQPMPTEFRDTKAVILCNDCSGKSTVAYHWLGLKCYICRSYNTVELHILSGDSGELQPAVVDRLASAAASIPATYMAGIEGDAQAPVIQTHAVAATPMRRHSSHRVELEHQLADRFARSMSPAGMNPEMMVTAANIESDSEDDMLGFWRGGNHDNISSSDEYGDSEESEEDDDDDDDEAIVLIGHR